MASPNPETTPIQAALTQEEHDTKIQIVEIKQTRYTFLSRYSQYAIVSQKAQLKKKALEILLG